MLYLLILTTAFANATGLFVEDVSELVKIERQGFSFSRQMGEAEFDLNAEQLYSRNSGYKLIVDALTKDLQGMRSNNTGPGMKYSRRLFDSGWLRSKKSRFELAGITIRHDRGFRHPGSCGEIRLTYRLAYQDDEIKTFSRLPMTFQHVRVLRAPCKPEAKIASLLENSDLLDVELNLQSVRWPAGIRPDMGAYAEYILRVFEKQSGRWSEKVLENTVDVAKIKSTPALKKELLDWLRKPATVQLVDRGEAVLDEKFLTKKGVSVAVHGMNRLANRLFDQIFDERDFSGLSFAELESVKSPKGYLRKLDEMTCVGCHQSQSIAGFHFLGRDRSNALIFNRVHIPFSNHFWSDLKRRAKIEPGSQQVQMGFLDRPAHVRGEKNERCYVGNDASFSKWTCVEGLKCEPVGAAEGAEFFGVCQEPKEGLAGDACYFGRVSQNADGKKDQETSIVSKECQGQLGCLRPTDGYPGGLCFANFCNPNSDKTCGALAVPGFNPCLARGRPFRECLENFTGSIEAGGCSLEKLCRDDFICMEGFKGKGVCAPPYSLFQLRVDGHLRP